MLIRLPIETERLMIRPLQIEDATSLHELYSDAEAMGYLVSEVPTTIEESRSWLQGKIDLFVRDDGMSLWAVEERETGHVVGDAGLQWEELEGERLVDLGCRLIPRYWGRGYAVEASSAILEAGFRDLDVGRITAMTHVGNKRARRALARLGGRYEREVEDFGMTMALYGFERVANPSAAGSA